VKLLVIGKADEEMEQLRFLLRDIANIGFVEVDKAYYMNPPPGLDAILLTLPAAERWNPDFRSRRAQVLSTSEEDRKEGFPPFIVTGVNLVQGEPEDLPSQLRILLERALQAVEETNTIIECQISNLGIWAMDLTRCATTSQVSEMLHSLLSPASDEAN